MLRTSLQYRSRGIKVFEIRADGEFSCIQDGVPCRIATAAPGTHVPEVERSIRHIKEGVEGERLICLAFTRGVLYTWSFHTWNISNRNDRLIQFTF